MRRPSLHMAPKVVALGGGHGLYASLSALRLLSDHLTALVTVADDGGSSGRLRDEFGVLPPGDLRMALSALCEDTEWGLLWRDVLQHRYETSGPLDHHAVGNLLIVALWELLDDPIAGLDYVGKLLNARGRVLPAAAVPLDIEAELEETDVFGHPVTVRGQSKVAVIGSKIKKVRLIPEAPASFPESVAAILEADWVILGPGSWFTSVLPHLLIPEIREALEQTDARKVVVLNLDSHDAETRGMNHADHIQVLYEYAPNVRFDTIIADPSAVEDVDVLIKHAKRVGSNVLLRQVRDSRGVAKHDPLRLAATLKDVFDQYLGDIGTSA